MGRKYLNVFRLGKLRQKEAQEKIMSPFGMAYTQLNETISNTSIDISTVEPEFSYLQYHQPTKERPEYWNNLGCLKSRSVIQPEESMNVIERVVKEAGTYVASEFTDGSCRSNPGPCGAGACLLFPSQERMDLYQLIARRASILLGELVAIKITQDQVKVTLFPDSQSAVGILTFGWQNNSHKHEITRRWVRPQTL